MTAAAALCIRPFADDDTESVVTLWRDCGLTRPWNDPYRDIARKALVQPELFVVALLDQQLVGSAMAGYDGHRGWVNYLAVSPSHRRHGIGKRLMRHVEDALVRIGCPKLNLQVRGGNEPVLDFYRALGYQLDDVVSLGRRLVDDTAAD